MLKFDADTARILDNGYQGSDILRRQLANLAALDPRRGETIIDVGAGTGLLTLDLARAVGPEGTVMAVDPSPEMRDAAAARCADRPNVRVLEGRADDLPLDDGVADRAVSLQAFEYIADPRASLAEIRRVLRPGGKLVIGDLHWDSLVWHADDMARMARMLDIWSGHVAERRTPAVLPPLLRAAGFRVDAVVPELCHDCVFRADGLANMMAHLIRAYAKQTGLAGEDELDGWTAEQHRIAKEGRFFFAITHYVMSASKV